MAGIIIGGWDPLHGPSVYSIPLGGSLHKRPFAIGGSGSSYIYGYCDANYREGMTREECIQFTKNGKFLMLDIINLIALIHIKQTNN
jgi:20S proteasome subunit beta 1